MIYQSLIKCSLLKSNKKRYDVFFQWVYAPRRTHVVGAHEKDSLVNLESNYFLRQKTNLKQTLQLIAETIFELFLDGLGKLIIIKLICPHYVTFLSPDNEMG